jgi:hypothetical protein
VSTSIAIGEVKLDAQPLALPFKRGMQSVNGTFRATEGDELGFGFLTPGYPGYGDVYVYGPNNAEHDRLSLAAGPGVALGVIRVSGVYSFVMVTKDAKLLPPKLILTRS